MKLNATDRSVISAIAVIMIIIVLIASLNNNKSMYQPREIAIKEKTNASIFDIPWKTKCLPGPNKEADYYTKDVYGICGAQELVNDYASYEIEDGIGGVLI